jgi:hypothetical protein
VKVDPSANLKEQLDLARELLANNTGMVDAMRLAELVLALDSWLRAGGFAPSAWRQSVPARPPVVSTN